MRCIPCYRSLGVCADSHAALRRKNGRNTRWSAEETELLIDSVIVRGTGSWADILATHRATFHPTRSSVDLKDKWRNLVKVSTVVTIFWASQMLLDSPKGKQPGLALRHHPSHLQQGGHQGHGAQSREGEKVHALSLALPMESIRFSLP